MKKVASLAVFLSFLLTLMSSAGEVYLVGKVRTWTSDSGKHRTEAKLIGVSEDGQTVTLHLTDGKTANVALDTLSTADQEYVAKQQAEFRWISADGFRVTLRMKDGKQAEFPMSALTKASREYVQKRRKDARAIADEKDIEQKMEKANFREIERELQARERINSLLGNIDKLVREEERKQLLQYACATCKGDGIVRCGNCAGRGRVVSSDGFNVQTHGWYACPQCSGRSRVDCRPCEGSGTNLPCKNLWDAAGRGTVTNVQWFILVKGFNVNVRNPIHDRNTPLHYAAAGGNLPVVQYLLSMGANIVAKNNKGADPFYLAKENGKIEVATFLLTEYISWRWTVEFVGMKLAEQRAEQIFQQIQQHRPAQMPTELELKQLFQRLTQP